MEDRPGLLSAIVSGKGVGKAFSAEAGGHRWQRVPPTERRGRRQTSTITVAVLPIPRDLEVSVREEDLQWTAKRGSGPGGQHRNTTESAVEVVHTPTGIKAQCQTEKSQHAAKRVARRLLVSRIAEAQAQDSRDQRSSTRKNQVGSGMRGDKVRTSQSQNNRVVNHGNGRSMQLDRYLRGFIEEITE